MDDVPLSQPSDANLTSARLCAAGALCSIMGQRELMDVAMSKQAYFESLSARDRAFARLLVATTLRRLGQIDAILKPRVKRRPPEFVRAVLRLGVTQTVFLKTPPHAAVGETVDLLKHSSKMHGFTGLVNAILRQIVRTGAQETGARPLTDNIPTWLQNSWALAYGKPALRRMAVQLGKTPPLDIYVRNEVDSWAERLGGDRLSAHTVRLAIGPSVTDLPGFADGAWWVQDIAASQTVASLGPIKGLEVLDLCAAPGGKTLQMAGLGAHVTALDKSEARLGRLQENLTRTGLHADIIVADALAWCRENSDMYDIVLLDAPCTATGTFRRHPDVLYTKTARDRDILASLQRRLLKQAAQRVKPGGRLVYCTCSLENLEGENQISQFLAQNPIWELCPINETQLSNLPDSALKNGYYRLLPHYMSEKGGMDGFFTAILRRR